MKMTSMMANDAMIDNDKNNMQRVSSNATLFLKIFLPTFWVCFFGLLTLGVWSLDLPNFGNVSAAWFKGGLSLFFVLGTTLLYFTFFRLKRVEMDELFVYASNYFKTYRYPFHNIEKITEHNLGIFHLVHVHLHTPGNFGKKITFLLDGPMFEDFLAKFPDTAMDIAKLRRAGK